MSCKKTYLLALMLATTAAAAAQDFVSAVKRNEFSAYAFGGLSTLQYRANELSITPGLGGGIGLGYALCFDERMAFVTGLEIVRYRAVAKANSLKGGMNYDAQSLGLPDSRYEMYLYSDFVGYEEHQRATYIQLPLMWQVTIPLTTPLYQLYAAAGVKVGFAVAGRVDVEADQLTTYAFFPQFDQTFYNRPEHSLETNSLASQRGSFDLTYDLLLSVELGVRHVLRNNWAVGLSLYFDYGYIDVPHRSRDGLVAYNDNQTGLIFNSVLTSQHNSMATSAAQPTSYSYVTSANLLSTGIKLKVLFGKTPSVNIFLMPVPAEDAPSTTAP
ncbi:MAG: outer membrane beta-barrel protein [Prevotellaceae bacterium]|nr:outer membrane beta-barrel protein [Prevotellaceae bacterium]